MYGEKKFLESLYISALFPNLIAILGGTINVFIDGILVGQKLGDLGIAAINQSLAVYLLLCTLGSLIGAGAAALSSAALGKHHQEECDRYFSLAIEMAVVLGGAFCLAGFFASPALAAMLGSTDSASWVETYIRITFIGGIFKIFLYIPFNYLRLIGKTAQSAKAMLLMTVLNIGLDFLFLFYFDWGVAGAAWASNLATIAACVFSSFFLFTREAGLHFSFALPGKEQLLNIVQSGSPMAANNLFSALRIIFLNQIMNMVGGSAMVAVFAITNNVNEFSICLQNGIPQAGSCMLGICYGEKDKKSMQQLVRLQMKVGVILSLIFSCLVTLFAKQIGELFGTKLAVGFPLLCWALSLIPGMINNIMIYYYYAVMKSFMANVITFFRVLAATVLVAAVLAPMGQAIWLFYPAGELLTIVIWMAGILLFYKLRGEKPDLYLLQDFEIEESQCTNFQVECEVEKICEKSQEVTAFCEDNGFSPEQTMTISLALEELMIIMAEKSMDNRGFLDVRVLRTREGGILRIRSRGKHFNPLEFAENDMDYLGVSIIMQMAKNTIYQTTLGLNTLVVEI
ncbi:MAG: hypothetical protein IKW28_00630 [Lachnospiraceae bacterium]|nr:hypothetical protein [Lachnospiraceae bacterium]